MTDVKPVIRVLGPVGLDSANEERSLRGHQQKMLGVLAVGYPNPVPRHLVVEALWPGSEPKSTKNNLGVVLHRLRNRLPESITIITEDQFYRLDVAPDQLDHVVFTDLIEQAERMLRPVTGRGGESAPNAALQPGLAVHLLKDALALWRGEAFQPFAEDSEAFTAAAMELAERKRHSEELLLEALMAAGEPHEAANLATAYTRAEPYRERRWELLMLALYQTGQQTEALRGAYRARSVLSEAGLVPGPQLQQLESAILEHDPSLLSSLPPKTAAAALTAISSSIPKPAGRLPNFISPLPPTVGPIPTTATRFVGRTSELSALAEVVDANRWVTVCGVPGVGKSRLVNRFAKGESDRHVVWLNVADMNPGDVAPKLSKMIGLGPNDDQQLAALTATLNEYPTLLVLDDIEPTDETVELVAGLVAQEGNLRVLTTSRSTFDHQLEVEFILGDLPLDDAVDLVRRGAGIDADAAQMLIETVGTLPLILEVLVGQFQLATVAEILDDLDHSLRPVGKTVQSALDWSTGRLEPSTLDLYEHMSVMAGWCSVADLAGLAKRPTGEIRHRLKELVDHGLVRSSSPGPANTGYTLYRQNLSMRTHARLRLTAAGRLDEVTAAHATYFYRVALEKGAATIGLDEQDAVEYLNRVSDDLRLAFDRLVESEDFDRAVDFVLALDEYTFFRLEYDKLGWQDRLVDIPAVADHPGYARLLATAGLAAWVRDRMGPANDLADRSLAVATTRGEPIPITALNAKLNVAAANQDLQNAPLLLEQLIDVANDIGTAREISNACVNQVLAYTYTGMAQEAFTAAKQAIETAERSSNPTSKSWAKCGLGFAQLPARPKLAARSFAEALRVARTVQNKWIAATALSGLATAARLSGRTADAAGSLATLIDVWVALRKDTFLARTLNEVALVLADLNRDADARTVLSWTNGFTADVLFLIEDRERLMELQRRLDPPLTAELFNPRQIAKQAHSLLENAGGQGPHSL